MKSYFVDREYCEDFSLVDKINQIYELTVMVGRIL